MIRKLIFAAVDSSSPSIANIVENAILTELANVPPEDEILTESGLPIFTES